MIETMTQHQWTSFGEEAQQLGFSQMAAAPADPVKCAKAVQEWVAAGHHAEMHWYARSLEKRLDPQKVMPEAQSVIILTIPYHPESCTLGGYQIARYACGDDYHDVILKRLKELCARIHAGYPNAIYRPYVDTGPVLERYWAEQAGIGWIGKNGNLISRKDGSYLFLASVLTSLILPYGKPHAGYCGSCRACIDICPTDAFICDGQLDSRKCISYLNIEHSGPFEQAPDFAGWLFGCDLCQEVCPWTEKFSNGPVLSELEPRSEYAHIESQDLVTMDQVSFSTTFRKSAIKRTKLAGILRNLAHLQNHES